MKPKFVQLIYSPEAKQYSAKMVALDENGEVWIRVIEKTELGIKPIWVKDPALFEQHEGQK